MAHVMRFALALALVAAAPSIRGDGDVCSFTQLTDTTGGFLQDIDANTLDGTRIAFQTRIDLVGENPDGSFELFLLDTVADTLTQITDQPDSGGAAPRDPALDAAGDLVAYTSTLDPVGQNADGNSEIFLYDRVSDSTVQLTQTAAGENLHPAIDASGTLVAFSSNNDFTGQNADGTNEIFTLDLNTMGFRQITDAPSGISGRPEVSADGTRIVFHSDSDLAGGNADGNTEIFLADTVAETILQVSHSVGNQCVVQRISGNGNKLAFMCNNEPAGGSNPNGNYEIFLYDVPSATLTQVTDTPTSTSSLPWSLGPSGDLLAFRTRLDLTGKNPDGNEEIFLFETGPATFTQVTHTTIVSSGNPRLVQGATRVVFTSEGDLTGENADGNSEIFSAVCGGGPGSVPSHGDSPDPPLLIAKAGTGMLVLTWSVSCSASDDDYEIYEGLIGNYYSHTAKRCSTVGATTLTFDQGELSRYYLVVPTDGAREGSYGRDGDGNQRPQGADACNPQPPVTCS